MTTRRSYFQLEIAKRAPQCAACSEAFQPKQKYYSQILEKDEGELFRRDFCIKCWDSVYGKEQIITAWQGVVPIELEKKDEFLSRDQKAMALIKEMIADDTPENRQYAFILGLYLARKRHISLRKEVALKDGRKALLYEVLETEEMLSVPKMELSHLEIETIQKALAPKLKG